MIQFNPNLKDWQIAKSMFGKHHNEECKIVKKLRKPGYKVYEIEPGHYMVEERGKNDGGWYVNEENMIKQ